MSIELPIFYRDYEDDSLEWKYLKCECGVDKTYGKDAKPWMHATYCRKFAPDTKHITCNCGAERMYNKDTIKPWFHEKYCPKYREP